MLANPMDTLEEILGGAAHLVAAAPLAQRLAEAASDPQAAPADLEKLLGQDPALAAEALALANSAYYGMPRSISTLREAVVFLGVKTLRRLPESRSAAPAPMRAALIRHGVVTARCARAITTSLPAAAQEQIGAEQAFCAGLLHDIGKLALEQTRPDLLASIQEDAAARNLRFSDVETCALPFGHGQIGASLAARWNLPPLLCEAIAFHHTPRAASLNPKLTAAVGLASEIAHFLEDGGDEAGLHLCCREAMFPLRLREDSLPPLVRACRAEKDKALL